MIPEKWKNALELIDFAFQPIVNIYTGVTFGFEALIRNTKEAGFHSIQDFFDSAYAEKCLYAIDLALREKVLDKYSKIPFNKNIKVFYNIDNRLLLMPDYSTGNTYQILQKKGLHPSILCFELSERHEFISIIETKSILNLYKQQAYKIAIDDFGTGYSGLQLLYHSEPDYMKIDRFFIEGISQDSRKKLFVSSVVNLSHILGIEVIAEGVETEEEYRVCKEIGCDFVQGYLIQRPTIELQELEYKYSIIVNMNQKNRRLKYNDSYLILNQLVELKPICYPEHNIKYIFEYFRKYKNFNFIPVIDSNHEPLGLIEEKNIKEYVYSPYGKELLMNKESGKTLIDFVTKTPISEINNKVEKILEIFSITESSEGIIITENGKYKGFLTAKALLHALNEKNIAFARDQNPLSKLPGNHSISDHIAECLESFEEKMFVYFDFDHFKPFNDQYGFRLGDRAILIFADILKEYSNLHQFFIGHIGGDDFFAAYNAPKIDKEKSLSLVKHIIDKFKNDAKNLYNEIDKEKGYMEAVSRSGELTRFDLLSVSAAILFLSPGKNENLNGDFGKIIAKLKKEAKESIKKYAYTIK